MGVKELARRLFKREKSDKITMNATPAIMPGIFPGEDEVRDALTAGAIACVKRCMEIKCGSVAGLGLHVLKRKSEGGRWWYEDDEGGALNRLLSETPNRRQNAFDFLWDVVYQREMYGNAYVVPVYSGGELVELVPVPEGGSVSYDYNRGVYTVNDSYDGIYGEYSEGEIIHLKSYSQDGFLGRPVTDLASKVLTIMWKTYGRQSDMFTQGSTLRGFITGDDGGQVGFGEIQDAQLETVTTRIRREIREGSNLGFLPGSMKFVPTSMTPADLQLLESMKFLNLEICRFFGVPPTQVFQDSNVNYKSTESSQTIFMTSTLAPLIRQIETELTVKLLTAKQRRHYKIRFDLDDYYQTDPAIAADSYMKLVQCGALTPNEARAKMGRRPVEGGDRLFISCNVAPIDSEKIKGNVEE